VRRGEIGCTVARASEYEPWLREEEIFGQDSLGTAGSEEFGESGQEGSKEEKNDLHTGESVGRRSGEAHAALPILI